MMKKHTNNITCRLCLKEKEIRNSHIFPEFFYDSLYDEKHRYIRIPGDPRKPFEQKGDRQKLLCADCEILFSRLEAYARAVLKGGIEISIFQEGRVIKVPGLDYDKFKLFEMSLLWRAGVAKGPSYQAVKLQSHEEKLRKMLIGADPGKSYQYGCIICYNISDNNRFLHQIIDLPTKHRTEDGQICYCFVLGGLLWIYVVSSHSVRHIRRDYFLTETGQLSVYLSKTNINGLINNLASKLASDRK